MLLLCLREYQYLEILSHRLRPDPGTDYSLRH